MVFRVLFIGGGSLGHITPLLAVWRALEKKDVAAAHFVCSERAEEQSFLREEDVSFTPVPLVRRSPLLLLHAIRNAVAAGHILESFRPHVILGKGGALSIPLCLRAQKQGIPIVLHESDAVMGRANRLLARWAETVCLGFPLNAKPPKMKRGTVVVTGNPVRPEMTRGSRERGLVFTGFSGHRPILLVLGGSQGAASLNAAIALHAAMLLQHWDIVHLTGSGKAGWKGTHSGYFVRPCAHHELPDLYACATLAVSRGGASIMSELAACGIPAVLVPLEGLAQNHQWENALAAAAYGGVRILRQHELREHLPDFLALQNMPRRRFRTMEQQTAACSIADILLQRAQERMARSL